MTQKIYRGELRFIIKVVPNNELNILIVQKRLLFHFWKTLDYVLYLKVKNVDDVINAEMGHVLASMNNEYAIKLKDQKRIMKKIVKSYSTIRC